MGRLVTQSVFPSGATPRPCDGEALNGPLSTFSAGMSLGSITRPTSFRAAKSTIANPCSSEICTNRRLVEPSGFFSKAIGRTPSLKSVQIGSSVFASMTVITRPAMDPATTCRPSGVTYTLWMPPLVGIDFTFSSEAASMTSTAPGADTMPT